MIAHLLPCPFHAQKPGLFCGDVSKVDTGKGFLEDHELLRNPEE
jgi:hypothetical protein